MSADWTINGRFLGQPQTGVQRYAGEMTRAIDARLCADDALARRMRWCLAVPADDMAVPPLGAIALRRSRHGKGQLWEQLLLPAAPGGLLNLANRGPIAHGRQIVCLHDANVFLEPSSYSRSFRLAYRAALPLLARRAAAVTTVSAFSAAMLARYRVTAGGRPATVIPNGHEHALRWDARRSAFSAPGRFPRPFVFALGSRARHKQIDLLLALAPALDALGLDLVVSGGSSAIFAGPERRAGGAGNVHHVGFVGDDDLAALFAQALCFAFPSRTEGFGLPLLEAMVHGAPVVASDCASMPEVCGDAVLYAPPSDREAWLAQFSRLAADPELRAGLRARGRARYPRFSWRAGADAYIALALQLSAAPAANPVAAPAAEPRPASHGRAA